VVAADGIAEALRSRSDSAMVQRLERIATPPVSAGVIDDNADFGAYLAYRERHAGLPVRARDVEERYRLTVHDAAGRPVNDAQVSLHAQGRALPLWARTDAGGQVWIHPGVMDAASGYQAAYRPAPQATRVIEVQVRRGGAIGRALLTRGQRDDLQVRLDARLPAERARLDLVFLVDATGSMADEIDKLKRSMRSMADQIARLPSQPDICFALVAYRDRGDAFFVRASDFSADLGAFQRTLGELQAGGGGDYPEALNEALHTAVHRLSWRGDGATRLVVLVADAPPHLDYGTPTYDDDMQGALARGIKLFAVGASGLDPTGEYVFRQAAQYTGGRFVFLTYADARDPSSGPGRETSHDVGRYSVESLDALVVRLVREELARRPAG
jgi:Mg-chelatase subunit ChlD